MQACTIVCYFTCFGEPKTEIRRKLFINSFVLQKVFPCSKRFGATALKKLEKTVDSQQSQMDSLAPLQDAIDPGKSSTYARVLDRSLHQ